MSRVQDYRELAIWREAMDLTRALYVATRPPPETPLRPMAARLRRPAILVLNHIRDGFESGRLAVLSRHLREAHRECADLQARLLVAAADAAIEPSRARALALRAERLKHALADLALD